MFARLEKGGEGEGEGKGKKKKGEIAKLSPASRSPHPSPLSLLARLVFGILKGGRGKEENFIQKGGRGNRLLTGLERERERGGGAREKRGRGKEGGGSWRVG